MTCEYIKYMFIYILDKIYLLVLKYAILRKLGKIYLIVINFLMIKNCYLKKQSK